MTKNGVTRGGESCVLWQRDRITCQASLRVDIQLATRAALQASTQRTRAMERLGACWVRVGVYEYHWDPATSDDTHTDSN